MSLQKSGQRKKQSKIQAILGVTNRQVETNKETKNLKKKMTIIAGMKYII